MLDIVHLLTILLVQEKIYSLLKRWLELTTLGPKIGYTPNASKSWLVIKQEYEHLATDTFLGTKVNVTTNGRKHLGAAIGSVKHKEEHVNRLVNSNNSLG